MRTDRRRFLHPPARSPSSPPARRGRPPRNSSCSSPARCAWRSMPTSRPTRPPARASRSRSGAGRRARRAPGPATAGRRVPGRREHERRPAQHGLARFPLPRPQAGRRDAARAGRSALRRGQQAGQDLRSLPPRDDRACAPARRVPAPPSARRSPASGSSRRNASAPSSTRTRATSSATSWAASLQPDVTHSTAWARRWRR